MKRNENILIIYFNQKILNQSSIHLCWTWIRESLALNKTVSRLGMAIALIRHRTLLQFMFQPSNGNWWGCDFDFGSIIQTNSIRCPTSDGMLVIDRIIKL